MRLRPSVRAAAASSVAPAEQPRTRAARHARELRLAQAALVEFGLPGAAIKLMKYAGTALFRVEAGERLALRLHPPERMPPAVVRAELAWLATLRREVGLPVPEPLPAPDGGMLAEVELPDEGRRYAALFRWLPGRHKPASLTAADARRVGELIGRLHQFAARYVPPPEFVRWDFDWGEFAGSTVERPRWPALLAPADRALLATAIEQVRAAMDQLGQHRDAWGLIHGDTNLSNFLFQRGSVALIDFEVCCYGYYLFDITRTLLEFEQYGERAPELAAAFYQGYRLVRELPDLDHPHVRAFQVMNVVDLIVWILNWDARMPLATGPRRVAAALERLRALV